MRVLQSLLAVATVVVLFSSGALADPWGNTGWFDCSGCSGVAYQGSPSVTIDNSLCSDNSANSLCQCYTSDTCHGDTYDTDCDDPVPDGIDGKYLPFGPTCTSDQYTWTTICDGSVTNDGSPAYYMTTYQCTINGATTGFVGGSSGAFGDDLCDTTAGAWWSGAGAKPTSRICSIPWGDMELYSEECGYALYHNVYQHYGTVSSSWQSDGGYTFDASYDGSPQFRMVDTARAADGKVNPENNCNIGSNPAVLFDVSRRRALLGLEDEIMFTQNSTQQSSGRRLVQSVCDTISGYPDGCDKHKAGPWQPDCCCDDDGCGDENCGCA